MPRWPLQNPPLVAGSKSPRRQWKNRLLNVRSEIQAHSFFIPNFLTLSDSLILRMLARISLFLSRFPRRAVPRAEGFDCGAWRPDSGC
jgi:hypothetical protein